MKSRWIFRSLFAGLALAAAGPAAAGNEAEYSPDGKLYVPHMKMLDAEGDVVASYAAYFEKSAGWNFKLYGLANAVPATGGTATNLVTSYVTNVVTVSNLAVISNYTYITNIYDGTNIIGATTSFNVTTDFFSETQFSITTNIFVTNSLEPADVAGTWQFQFGSGSYDRTFTGTEFGRTTIMTPNIFNVTLTLSQTNTDVTGTGLVDSVQYALTGEVANDLFVFTMLAGYTNRTINLVAGQALVGDGALFGEYFWSSSNGTKVNGGDFTAYKQ